MNARTKDFLARFQSVLALLLMVGALSLHPQTSSEFLTFDNGMNVLRQISINLCLSIGMTLVILSGGIDLSVGSVLALSGAVAAGLLKHGLPLPALDRLLQFTVSGALLAGVLAGLVLGWFNGFVITHFRLPPFVATLGMLSIARGLTMLWTKGYPITGLGQQFGAIGTGRLLGIPVPVWISGLLVGVFTVVTRKTRFGRYLYAVGGNERAALLSGLNLRRIKVAVYALGGGRGSVLGTVIGCLIIGILNNGLVLLGVSPFWQQVIKGFVILLAVALDKMSARED